MGQNSVMLEIESSSTTYRQKTSNSVYDKGTIPLHSNSERKFGFFSGHSCLWKVRLIPINSE